MSAMFPAGQRASLDDVAEACALLLPIAQASIKTHDWPPVVLRWLLQMHDSSRAAHVVDKARLSSAVPVKHPEVSITLRAAGRRLDGVATASRIANSVFDLAGKR